MPDADGFPTPQELIDGYGKPKPVDQPGKIDLPNVTINSDGPSLTEEQQKAIKMIITGMPFVIMCVKPTETGADFYTELYGDEETLRNAAPHLHDVMHRLFMKKGII